MAMRRIRAAYWMALLMVCCVGAAALAIAQAAAPPPPDQPPDSQPTGVDRKPPETDSERPVLSGPRGRNNRDRQEPGRRERVRSREGDPWHRDRAWPPWEGRPQRLTDDVIDRLMATLQEATPEIHKKFESLRAHDEAKFKAALQRAAPIIRECAMMRVNREAFAKTVAEEFQLEENLRGLSRQYHEARVADNREGMEYLLPQIERLVRRQVELSNERRKLRVEEFAARIRHQQERLAEEQKRLDDALARQEQDVQSRVERVKKGPMPELPPQMRKGPPAGDDRGPPSRDRPRRPRPDGPRPDDRPPNRDP